MEELFKLEIIFYKRWPNIGSTRYSIGYPLEVSDLKYNEPTELIHRYWDKCYKEFHDKFSLAIGLSEKMDFDGKKLKYRGDKCMYAVISQYKFFNPNPTRNDPNVLHSINILYSYHLVLAAPSRIQSFNPMPKEVLDSINYVNWLEFDIIEPRDYIYNSKISTLIHYKTEFLSPVEMIKKNWKHFKKDTLYPKFGEDPANLKGNIDLTSLFVEQKNPNGCLRALKYKNRRLINGYYLVLNKDYSIKDIVEFYPEDKIDKYLEKKNLEVKEIENEIESGDGIQKYFKILDKLLEYDL